MNISTPEGLTPATKIFVMGILVGAVYGVLFALFQTGQADVSG